MGNKQNYFVSDLRAECKKYKELLKWACKNNSNLKKRNFMMKYIKQYIKFFSDNDFESIENSPFLKWLWCVHKLHPKDYFERKKLTRAWFFISNKKLLRFADKMKNKYDDSYFDFWLNQYKIFLKFCKNYPNNTIIPNLIEDFVWHAHMQNPNAYEFDISKYVGRFLDHTFKIEDLMFKMKKKKGNNQTDKFGIHIANEKGTAISDKLLFYVLASGNALTTNFQAIPELNLSFKSLH